jgi:SAM-dependent methyltransferase
MLDLSYLNSLRWLEMDRLLPFFSPGAKILEFGAGTGQQAKFLADRGFEVVAVDLASSNYASGRIFPVIDYDGERLPLDDWSVDIIFSSNALEHVEDLPAAFAEFRRVLKPGGFSIHVLPTPAWRFWTFATNVARSLAAAVSLAACLGRPFHMSSPSETWLSSARQVASGFIPRAHGTGDHGLAELWTFSATAWRRTFERLGFEIVEDRPLGLFYTGNLLLGPMLAIERRRQLSRLLGSAVRVYLIRPLP